MNFTREEWVGGAPILAEILKESFSTETIVKRDWIAHLGYTAGFSVIFWFLPWVVIAARARLTRQAKEGGSE